MARKRPAVVTLVALFVLFPLAAEAQMTMNPTWQPEAGGSLAWGHTVRFGDQTFGDTPNLGLTLSARHETGLGFEVEVNKTFGLTPEPVPCSGVVPCTGEAVSGVRTTLITSGNVLYYFSGNRVRPYVIGGIGVMWTDWAYSITMARGHVDEIMQRDERDTGMVISFGGGLRIHLAENLSVRTELRVYDSSALSRSNLTLVRTSVGIGVGW
jgi:opacity protein-like surface antigen